MHDLVYWFGFAGGWLLFAGPMYQSVLELREEEDARTRMHELKDTLPAAPISPWWWLVPPARLVLASRRRNEQKVAVTEAMTPEDLAVVRRYLAIARGWMYVAGGAWLIALKETWELVEHKEWHPPTYAVLVVVMTLVALGVTGDRERRRGD